MTGREMEIIADNLRAFVHNFGNVRIEKEGTTGFYVYYPEDKPQGDYIQYCYNISYLDGFLYGCVIGFLRKELKDGAAKMKEEKKGIYQYE